MAVSILPNAITEYFFKLCTAISAFLQSVFYKSGKRRHEKGYCKADKYIGNAFSEKAGDIFHGKQSNHSHNIAPDFCLAAAGHIESDKPFFKQKTCYAAGK